MKSFVTAALMCFSAAGACGDEPDSPYLVEGEYRADFWTGLSGPLKSRLGVAGNVDLKLTADAEKAWGWDGVKLFAHVIGNHGNRPNRLHGATQGLDNIEVNTNTVRLFQAWVEKSWLNDRAAVLFGLLDLNAEFQVTESSALLIHPTFGTGAELAQSGRNGPSVFPVSSLALRGLWRFNDETSLRAAVFDGVSGDPAHPRGTHVRLGRGDGVLGVAELAYTPSAGAHKVQKLALGTWHYTPRFDHHVDVDSNGSPVRQHNRGVYAVGERTVWQWDADGSRGMDAFLRVGWANDAVNQMDKALGAGVLLRGPFAARPKDRMSVGIAAEHNSHLWREAKRNAGEADPVAEVAYELTYRAVINEHFALQPDIQWLRHRGQSANPNATVIGLRFDFTL